jgi:hypothetical protein
MSRRVDTKEKAGLVRWAGVVILVGVILAALLSCSPRIIERVEVRHDTTAIMKLDSVRLFERDSIYVREKGDTVFQYVERIRYRDRWRVDTLRTVRVDSVAVERIKEVKKPLSWWQKTRQRAFWPLLLSVAALLAWTFRKYIKKLFTI